MSFPFVARATDKDGKDILKNKLRANFLRCLSWSWGNPVSAPAFPFACFTGDHVVNLWGKEGSQFQKSVFNKGR